ncbi:hypothetical protein AAVH_36488, partial [Aphelenchoides avenae]
MEQMCPISKGSSGDDTVQVMLLYDAPRPSVDYPLLTVPYKDWDVVDDGYVKRCSRGSLGTYDPTGRNVESCICCDLQKYQQECASDWNIPTKSSNCPNLYGGYFVYDRAVIAPVRNPYIIQVQMEADPGNDVFTLYSHGVSYADAYATLLFTINPPNPSDPAD